MGRQAILIANSISYGERSKNISVGIVKSLIKDLSNHLESLDEYSFGVTKVVNYTLSEARRTIINVIKRAGNAGHLVLLYYFGHGFRSIKNELFLFFKDSKSDEEPTMFKFQDIVGWLESYRVPQVIIILDCCHAGTVARDLRLLDSYGGKYYLMASVTPKEKALVDYGDERPLGVFSKFLLSGFSSPDSRETLKREVSYWSLFQFVDEMTRTRSKQTPYSVDCDMAKEVFFKQKIEPLITKRKRTSVPRKSSYNKIFVICSYLLAKQFKTEKSFYNFMKKKEPIEFLTPVRIGPGRVEYELIGFDSFRRYLILCRQLGILDQDEPLRLTSNGKRIIRGDGKLFNYGLYEALKEIWKYYGLEIADLEDVISTRIRNNEIPSVDGIYRDVYFGKQLFVIKDIFKVLLDLTGYVDALKYSTDHTFFPPFKEERIQVK